MAGTQCMWLRRRESNRNPFPSDKQDKERIEAPGRCQSIRWRNRSFRAPHIVIDSWRAAARACDARHEAPAFRLLGVLRAVPDVLARPRWASAVTGRALAMRMDLHVSRIPSLLLAYRRDRCRDGLVSLALQLIELSVSGSWLHRSDLQPLITSDARPRAGAGLVPRIV